MDIVITLVAPGLLDPRAVARVVSTLGADHAERLSDQATDIFASGLPGQLRAAAASALADEAVDIIAQPVAGRRKRLLISDMDSTLIGQECIDELAAVHHLKPKVAAITERAMRGELDFAASLVERVALLKDIPEASIERLLAETITPSPGAATMVATLKANGVRTVLVSGGFTQFAEPVAERLGLDAMFANRLLVADGKLTGAVADPILGADAKRERLLAECDALGIAAPDAMALGDGANDLAMIGAAGLGVAYRAKPAVAAAADAEICHADLTAVLYAMGFKAGEFVSG
ncbi:phosphoserine phosphatase SerB [Acuticoccus sp. MNP-M23]|uniref:phosphoserine phosphatase SerB n=1 Tax=Acuticoccus sp. MNP-M23 TaxID=3072793 RepID=UPI00281551FC|nr:phosphoserine phosphatase SerB [Acuticoccus sp. MNP-M23]WMS41622.1 phosphoserine phosphatase SerB [Acuticoccus sp. MNP-M23]